MSFHHYIYNREGVIAVLGLSKPYQVNRYKDKAKGAGLQPSVIIGGVEMFDIDILMNPEEYIQTEPALQQQKRVKGQLYLF